MKPAIKPMIAIFCAIFLLSAHSAQANCEKVTFSDVG